MPPKLTSKHMFWIGLALSVIGVSARLFGLQIANSLIGPELLAGTAFTIAEILAEVLLTLGLVLVAVSPLARLVEHPPKRPDDTTLLIRDTLDRRATRKS
ncbi:MAG: hypothetical protein EPO52_12320 [Herbiconiux sp.]|uniref:hypothetical protein n=1 Tax=Herbiconiux sp. TaxID=1871186 RepID=UPI0011FF20C4|nr:hypothetical protein [Herbiconiux sp.]TAJ47280.1 MAG: hypothetical protein EPO52_12320 [Herbiconiux sp.]